MARLVLIILLLLTAAPGAAGPWLRPQGTGFLATSGTLRRNMGVVSGDSAIWAEYGLLPWLTLGLDSNDRPGQGGHVLGFLRVPLGPERWPVRVAAELALGMAYDTGGRRGMGRVTVAAGRGVETRFGPGWIAGQVTAEREQTGLPHLKLELTAGLAPTRGVRPMLQIELSRGQGQPPGWTVTPALTYAPKPGRVWVLGLEQRRAPGALTARTGLKLALWTDF